MAVFRYTAVLRDREGHVEQGTVIARDKIEAFDKLTRLRYTKIQLKKVEGLQALLQRLTADVK